jgi:hypothetical protein
MNREREFVAGAALSIGLTIIPLTGWIYWTLAAALLVLSIRLVDLSFTRVWAKLLGAVAVVLLLAASLVPVIR